MQNSNSAQNLNQNSGQPNQNNGQPNQNNAQPNQNNAQTNQNRAGGGFRANSLRYSQQQEVNRKLMREEAIKSITNTIWQYTCSLILLGILWLVGRSTNWGDDVSGLVRNTLIMYLGSMVITVILHCLSLSMKISKLVSFIAQIIVMILQIVWYIHWVDIFFRDSNNCRDTSSSLWWAHLIIVITAFGTFFLCSILICCGCLLLCLVAFAANEEMESKKNNAKMKNMLMGIAEFKMNSEEHLQEECIVCMDKYEPDSEIMRLPCNEQHYFHKDWILKWVERNPCCPLCKAKITPESLKKMQRTFKITMQTEMQIPI